MRSLNIPFLSALIIFNLILPSKIFALANPKATAQYTSSTSPANPLLQDDKRVAMLAIDFRPSWPLKSARMAATHFCAAHAADALVTGARVLRTLAAVSQMA